MTRIAVVIPFYQRRAGILPNALRSIAAQDTSSALHVFVVDDGSPIAATDEVSRVPEVSDRVTVLRQHNGGPGAARNTALDAAAGQFDLVAFLDSDDTWSPQHLSRAERAMAAGAEFFFSDYGLRTGDVTAFQRCRFDEEIRRQRRIDPDLLWHTTDFVDTVLRYHIGTGTVVYDFARFPQVRFPTQLRYSHEDTLFWLTIAMGTQRIAFSDQSGMVLGCGINIYGSAGWGTSEELARLRDEVAFARDVLRDFTLTGAQRTYLTERMREARRTAQLNALHQLSAVLRYFRTDPVALSGLLRQAGQRMRRRKPARPRAREARA